MKGILQMTVEKKLDELQKEAEQLVALLKDRQLEVSFWASSLEKRISTLHALTETSPLSPYQHRSLPFGIGLHLMSMPRSGGFEY